MLQWLKCGIPCPMPFPMSAGDGDFTGLGVVVMIFIIGSVAVGLATLAKVKGEVKNFFVAGRSLPLFVCGLVWPTFVLLLS